MYIYIVIRSYSLCQIFFTSQSIIKSAAVVIDSNSSKAPTKYNKSCSVPALNLHRADSEYNPIKYLYEEDPQGKTYSLVKDFLKFLKVKGMLCTGSFAAIPLNLQLTLNRAEYKPFAGQVRAIKITP